MQSLGRTFDRLGFVQADPIRSPARAQDLILRHRVTDYLAGDLERRYPRLPLEEAYLHAYGFMTRQVHAWLLPRHEPLALTPLAAEILDFVQQRGPTHPGALAERFGREREVNGWGGLSKATTRTLHILSFHGRLRVARRDSGVRVYQSAPAPEETATPDERIRHLTLLLARSMAPIPTQTLAAIMAPIIRSILGAGARTTVLADLLASGALVAQEADGIRYVWPADLPEPGRTRPSVRFLAPFDPLVWDRRRFEHLWGWPYRFEAYTPPSRRRLGYYAMPLLWREAVIGWVNVARRGGRLDVQPGFVAGPPDTAEFTAGYEAEVARMERFLSADETDATTTLSEGTTP